MLLTEDTMHVTRAGRLEWQPSKERPSGPQVVVRVSEVATIAMSLSSSYDVRSYFFNKHIYGILSISILRVLMNHRISHP